MRTVSLTDLEPTHAAPPPHVRGVRGLTRTQRILSTVQAASPLVFAAGLSGFAPEQTRPFFDSAEGLFALAGLTGLLLAGVLALWGFLFLVNRAAPHGKSNAGFRALCHAMALSATSVAFTVPICGCLAYGPVVVELLRGG